MEIAQKRNKEIEDRRYFELHKFWTELSVFKYKHNISNIKIGIIFEHFENNITYQFDTKNITDHIYNDLVAEINNKNNEWENFKIKYFTSSDLEKFRLYNISKSTDRDYTLYVNSPFLDQVKDICKREDYYKLKSAFYSSQSEFEKYMDKRSFVAVDRSTLKNILGEYGLSQSGLTKYYQDENTIEACFKHRYMEVLNKFRELDNDGWSKRSD
jgi:hypothetical protein